MPDAGSLTDFQRLQNAFSECRDQGYGAHLAFGWTVCCRTCGHAEAERGPKGYLFTHQQSYGRAFWGDQFSQPLPELIEAEIAAARPWLLADVDDGSLPVDRPDDLTEDDESDLASDLREAWSERADNADRLASALDHERRYRWHTLSSPLHLYWSADSGPAELVAILRSHGLPVATPEDAGTAITVSPSERPAPPPQPWPGDPTAKTLAADRTHQVSAVLRALCEGWPLPAADLIPPDLLPGTADPQADADRCWRLVDWLARRALPTCLQTRRSALRSAQGADDLADLLPDDTEPEEWRTLPPITDASKLDVLRPRTAGLSPGEKLLLVLLDITPSSDMLTNVHDSAGFAAISHAIDRVPGLSYRDKITVQGLGYRAGEALGIAHKANEALCTATVAALRDELATVIRDCVAGIPVWIEPDAGR